MTDLDRIERELSQACTPVELRNRYSLIGTASIIEVVPALIAEHRAALATVEALYDERNNLRHVLSHAQVAFRHYAQNHRAKGTPEGDAKAETNQQLADLMKAALEPRP